MTAFAASLAVFAPAGQQGGPGLLVFVAQILLFIGIFYFLLIRPHRQQQQRHKQLLDSLQRGDQIVTTGGIIGEVLHLKDNEVTIRSGETRLVIARSGVANITNRRTEEAKEAKRA